MTEAPTPNNNGMHFDIVSDSKTYSIDMTITHENIAIKANAVNSLKNDVFDNSFSLSQIQSNKYFKMCESLNEAFLLLTELANSKEKKVITNSAKEISIVFPINNALVKEISFQLKLKEKNLEDKVNELYNLVERQQTEINSLKKEVEELKAQKKKEEENQLEKLKLKSSLILNKDKDEAAIREWINPYKRNKFTLIFRMSRDGAHCSDFHRCCDNKGPTLLLIKTDKNYRFGAYTPLNWVTPSSGEINDPSDNITFLFSLNKMKKFTKIPGKNPHTARSQKDYGPLLGFGPDLGVNADMRTGWSNNDTYLTNRELHDGGSNDNFNISEMEVFQVEETK